MRRVKKSCGIGRALTCRIARVKMLHSVDVAHSLRTGVLYCQNVMQFHDTLLPNFIHAHTNRTVFPAPIFAKFKINQSIFKAPPLPKFIHFGQKCRKYVHNFKYSNKYGLQCTDFHETQKFYMALRGHLLHIELHQNRSRSLGVSVTSRCSLSSFSTVRPTGAR